MIIDSFSTAGDVINMTSGYTANFYAAMCFAVLGGILALLLTKK